MTQLISLFVQLVAMLIEATIVRLMWNLILPELFDFPTIDFLQSFGLLLISNCLFKNTLSKVRGEE
jgi:hypothetical protein